MSDSDQKKSRRNPAPENPEKESPPSARAEDKTAETPVQASDLEKKLKDLQAELLYQRADFENFRKRMQREQEKAVLFSNERFISELLTIVDQLERALAHANGQQDDPLLEGIKMTHQSLLQMLGRFGVEFVGREGEEFNPAHHEAISEQEGSGEKPNSILAVHQKGCLLHGRLLKPAKVVVAKASAREAN